MENINIVFLQGDTTELSQAIIKGSGADNAVDNNDDPLHFDHVGLQVDGVVIEAGFHTGVVATPFDSFVGRAPGFLVFELPTEIDGEAATKRAESFVGLGYNHLYTHGLQATPPMLYCSELIREACMCHDGSYFFSEIPLNFCDSTGEPLPYWTEHYRRLGALVPQGFPGTSPLSIYKDLIRHRSFLKRD